MYPKNYNPPFKTDHYHPFSLLSVGNMLKGNLNMIIGLTNLNPVLFPQDT